MSSFHPVHRSLSAWARLAVLLSFLAVLWAQARPVTMLGQDLQAARPHAASALPARALGCHPADSHGAARSVDAIAGNAHGMHSGSAPLHHVHGHCDLCASLGWVFPPLAVCAIPSFAGVRVAAADVPARTSAAIPGLPFGRGPPFTLN